MAAVVEVGQKSSRVFVVGKLAVQTTSAESTVLDIVQQTI